MSSSEPRDNNAASISNYGVVLFQSVHFAMRAEKILLEANVTFKLIPVPRHLSSDCGFCVRFTWSDREIVEKLLAHDGSGVTGIEVL